MITQARLKELIEYLPDSGFFIWRVSRGRFLAGSIAGKLHVSRSRANYAYVSIKVDGKDYAAHRLAVLYMTGVYPPSEVQIDHRDGSSLNNIWKNLRPSTHTQNQQSRGVQRNNKLGLRGVIPHKGRYRARISINNKRISLGVYDDPLEAHAVYLAASKEHCGEFACR